MRARNWGVSLLLLGLAPLTLGSPAQAAKGPYTIYASGFTPAYPSSLATVLSGCSAAVLSSPLNGIDSYMVAVPEYAGKSMVIEWTGVAAPAVGNISSSYYNAACQRIPATGDSSTAPGRWAQSVPASARYLLVTATGTGNVTFKLLP